MTPGSEPTMFPDLAGAAGEPEVPAPSQDIMSLATGTGSFAPPLWAQNMSYAAADARALVTAMWPRAGTVGAADLAVTPTTPNSMNVNVAPGNVVVPGTDEPRQGSYLCQLREAVTVNIGANANPPAGQSRIDLIVARVNDAAVFGSTNGWSLVIVPGSPTTGTPQPPAVGRSSTAIARVLVSSGTATIAGTAITDMRGSPRTPAAYRRYAPAPLGVEGGWWPVAPTAPFALFEFAVEAMPGGYVLVYDIAVIMALVSAPASQGEVRLEVRTSPAGAWSLLELLTEASQSVSGYDNKRFHFAGTEVVADGTWRGLRVTIANVWGGGQLNTPTFNTARTRLRATQLGLDVGLVV